MKSRLKIFMRKNKFCDFLVYVAYKICSVFYSLLFLFCRIFPIKVNKIVCCNMKGKGYGDNPRYIVDEIIRQGLDYEIIWLKSGDRDEDMPEKVKTVPYNPFSLAYHLSTAKIWIDNNLKALGTLKRGKQFYIQTWHGNYGIKKIGYDINQGQALMEVKPYDYNSKIEDVIISNSKMTTSIYKRAFHYNGEILEYGNPRNDIFFQSINGFKEKVFSYFAIARSKKIILYAPTFRNDYSADCMRMDFDLLTEACGEKFGGEWVVLIRLHPNNANESLNYVNYSENIINATDYNSMSELLAVSDILITDYSSCMFDFAIRENPCFIYATDIEKYKEERDFYFDIMDLPFPVAQNMNGMVKNILEFNEIEYDNKLQKLYKQVGLCEDGTACEKVVSYIKQLK